MYNRLDTIPACDGQTDGRRAVKPVFCISDINGVDRCGRSKIFLKFTKNHTKRPSSGGASYGAKGLKPPPQILLKPPPDFCIK